MSTGTYGESIRFKGKRARGPGDTLPSGPDTDVVPMPVQGVRLDGLDLFRGLTVAAMILVNNPADISTAPYGQPPA